MSHGEKYGEEDKSFATEPGTWERDEDYQEFSDDQDDKNDKRHIRTRAMVASHLKWSSSKKHKLDLNWPLTDLILVELFL